MDARPHRTAADAENVTENPGAGARSPARDQRRSRLPGGKGEAATAWPHGFARDRERSFGDPATENLLFHGDNLRVLRALRGSHEGRFRCVYLDPPFNTGRAFAEYDDRRAPTDWKAMMAERIEALVPLVADDGAVFAEIDDTELGTFIGLLDSAFGRENRGSIVTIVRSAATGHKAKNKGPVNVTDYLLIYAKNKKRWKCKPLVRPRRGYDGAYATFIENRAEAADAWRFVPLATHVARALGYSAIRDARRALGDGFLPAVEKFALEHADAVCRFAQPRYEAISRAAQALIDVSRRDPLRVYCLGRGALRPLLLRGGNRLLFLSNKVAAAGPGGRPVLVEPLTNVWDDIPFQGIAREGGVVFSRNKKPEQLLARIVELATDPGDWVLDPFLGSGTTAAVAHKMRRNWVGIEEGIHIDSLCIPRLQRVVSGTDETGITHTAEWQGGGGFAVFS